MLMRDLLSFSSSIFLTVAALMALSSCRILTAASCRIRFTAAVLMPCSCKWDILVPNVRCFSTSTAGAAYTSRGASGDCGTVAAAGEIVGGEVLLCFSCCGGNCGWHNPTRCRGQIAKCNRYYNITSPPAIAPAAGGEVLLCFGTIACQEAVFFTMPSILATSSASW